MKLIYFFMMILLVGSAFALDGRLENNRNILYAGDNFNSKVIVGGEGEYVIEAILRDSSSNYINLLPPIYGNSAGTHELFDFTVDSTMEPGLYKLNVRIIGEDLVTLNDDIIIKEEKASFDFSVYACNDFACSSKSKVFQEGDTIYIGYKSHLSSVSTNGILTTPSGYLDIRLPYTLRNAFPGNYVAEIVGTVSGYDTASATVSFSVVEPVVIKDARVCIIDSICSGSENAQNCPADCATGEADSICDMRVDGKCDPDCTADPDCVDRKEVTTVVTAEEMELIRKDKNWYWVYVIIGTVLIGLIIFFWRVMKR